MLFKCLHANCRSVTEFVDMLRKMDTKRIESDQLKALEGLLPDKEQVGNIENALGPAREGERVNAFGQILFGDVRVSIPCSQRCSCGLLRLLL